MTDPEMLKRHLDQRWNSILGACTKNKWDENQLTFQVLDATRDALDGTRLDVGSDRLRIKCTFFKQKGSNETARGDVAFLVHIRFRDAKDHEGVAFLEAKKRDWPGETYAALKKGQAKRIFENARYSKALLFDHQPFAGLDRAGSARSEGLLYAGNDYFVASSRGPCSCHACVVPVELVEPVAGGTKAASELNRFGVPWADQIVDRYLRGVDLDFRPDIIKVAKGHAAEQGVPDGLVALTVGHGDVPLLPIEDLDINLTVFEEVPRARRP